MSLIAEASSDAIAKGLLANATSEVTLDGAVINAAGGAVTLRAGSSVQAIGTKAEQGDTYFGNNLAGTVFTSFSTATVNVIGTTSIPLATST